MAYKAIVMRRIVSPGAHPQLRLLEDGEADLTIGERLIRAATRVDGAALTSRDTAFDLRHDQVVVFRDFADYLLDIATAPASETHPPFGRIIQPPRTGKTVVAGHIIDRTGLSTVFLVPTRALARQTIDALHLQLPGVPIGAWYADEKRFVEHGVNVLTYAMLLRGHAEGWLPPAVCRAALVFADEGHRAMTAARMVALKDAFLDRTLRIALTATPDYDPGRRLGTFFPDLIHEVTLDEALALGLLAPLRVFIAEIDAEGSRVRCIGGDFDAEDLGRLMSAAPFFRAVAWFRYGEQNRRRPALIACASRRQATDLHRYLVGHRPSGTRSPALILGETPAVERNAHLASFEAGECDTIIQVGVLIEGWNSPRCKLLIDLAPSLSRVHSTQKYFRVMTRQGDDEARICVLLPQDLPYLPVLPMELFATLDFEDLTADLPEPDDGGGRSPMPISSGSMPHLRVSLRQRLLLDARVAKPTLEPGQLEDVRRVLGTCPAFDLRRPCGLPQFRWLFFQHALFVGRGDYLLRWLRIPPTREAYLVWLARLDPESVAARLLDGDEAVWLDVPCAFDVEQLELAIREAGERGAPVDDWSGAWRAVCGGNLGDDVLTPEDLWVAKRRHEITSWLIDLLKPRQRQIMRWRLGLDDGVPRSCMEMAPVFGVSSSRVEQIVKTSIRKLRSLHDRPLSAQMRRQKLDQQAAREQRDDEDTV